MHCIHFPTKWNPGSWYSLSLFLCYSPGFLPNLVTSSRSLTIADPKWPLYYWAWGQRSRSEQAQVKKDKSCDWHGVSFIIPQWKFINTMEQGGSSCKLTNNIPSFKYPKEGSTFSVKAGERTGWKRHKVYLHKASQKTRNWAVLMSKIKSLSTKLLLIQIVSLQNVVQSWKHLGLQLAKKSKTSFLHEKSCPWAK